jgi:hypothetical protein
MTSICRQISAAPSRSKFAVEDFYDRVLADASVLWSPVTPPTAWPRRSRRCPQTSGPRSASIIDQNAVPPLGLEPRTCGLKVRSSTN